MVIINVIKISEYLSQHLDIVGEIIELLGFTNITFDYGKKTIRFAREEGRNPTSVVLYGDTLKYYCFSTNTQGNIYSLVMERENLNFPQSLKWVAAKAGLNPSDYDGKIKLPFGGFYKKILRTSIEPELNMPIYNKEILKQYEGYGNMMFYNDGIDFSVQKKYNIGYDIETNRITVPIFNLNGDLCGIMGRLNDKNCEHSERWLPIIPCSRSLTLTGYVQNYQTIQEKQTVIIGESEKFPQQLDTFGCRIGLATSGCKISSVQARYIKSLMLPTAIIAYDEGLDEEQLRNEAKKLVINNSIFHNKVGYIFDDDNEILPKGSKKSPSDLGKQAFQELLKRKVRWL